MLARTAVATGHDYFAAQPFELDAYAQRASGSLLDFCRDLGLHPPAAHYWAKGHFIPWSVFEAARKKFGTLGFGTPPKVRRSKPLRIPARFLTTDIVQQPQSNAPPLQPHTVADLLRWLAAKLDEERKAATEWRETVEGRLNSLDVSVNALLKKQALADMPRPMWVAAPQPKSEPSHLRLEDVLRAQNGNLAEWVVTNRAEHDYSSMPPDVQDRVVQMLKRVLAPDANWRTMGAAKLGAQVPRHLVDARNAWLFRVGKYRLLIGTEGTQRRVVALPARNDKTVFARER